MAKQLSAPSDVIGYDDLQGAVTSARTLDGGQLSVASVQLPAGSGNAFPLYEWGIGDVLYITYQTSHKVKLNSIFEDHIHCCTATDPTGTAVAFEIKVVFAGVGSKYAAPDFSPLTKVYNFTADWSLGNFLIDLLETEEGMNPTVSSLIKISVERLAAGDTLGSTKFVEVVKRL